MSDCQSGPTNGGRPVPINSRHPATDDSKLQSAVVNGIEVAAGDRVRLRPQQRADAVDLLLVGRTATVV
ncbi:MAG TPA: hypothetical protein P5255_14215, partial [Phycisphaerae bacterium]|nr:hypothetical protein [Phycisphaerae bacterium]